MARRESAAEVSLGGMVIEGGKRAERALCTGFVEAMVVEFWRRPYLSPIPSSMSELEVTRFKRGRVKCSRDYRGQKKHSRQRVKGLHNRM